MNNSYIEEMKNSLTPIPVPMDEAQLAQLGTLVDSLKAPTKLIAKSERIPELQKELEVARSLRAKAEALVPAWRMSIDDAAKKCGKMPDLSFEELQFFEYEKGEEKKFVSEYVEANRNRAFYFLRTVHTAINGIYQQLRDVEETLEYNLEMEQKGTAGEIGVENYLRRNLSCRIMNSVVLPSAQTGADAPKTAETDLLVISQHGVYVCEIKNYGKAGQTLDVQPNGSIAKLDYYGRFLENMGSPTVQNQHHCAAVAKVLADAGLPQVPVYSVIIIANTEVSISNHSRYAVMDMYAFRDMVNRRIEGLVLTEEEMQSVYAVIMAKRMTERKFPIVAVSPIRAQTEDALAQIERAAAEYGDWWRESSKVFQNSISKANAIWIKAHPKLAKNQKRWQRVKSTPRTSLLWLAMGIIAAILEERGVHVNISYTMIAVVAMFLCNPDFEFNRDKNKRAKRVYIAEEESSDWVSMQSFLLLVYLIIRFTMPIWLYFIYWKFNLFPNWN